MILKRLLIAIFPIFLFACSENFVTMDEVLPTELNYTDAEYLFDVSPKRSYITAVNSDTIYGYYNSNSMLYIFHSFDGLKTIETNKIESSWRVLYMEQEKIVAYKEENTTSEYRGFCVLRSNNYGKTYSISLEKPTVYKEYVSHPVFKNYDKGIFFVTKSGYGTETIVYEINGDSYQSIDTIYREQSYSSKKLLAYTVNNQPLFIEQRSDQAANRSYFVNHSSDNGKSWQTQKMVSQPPLFMYYWKNFFNWTNFKAISEKKYMFLEPRSYEVSGGYDQYYEVYYSYNSGISWEQHEFNLPGYIISIDFVDENTAYLLLKEFDKVNYLNSMLYISIDGGETWRETGKEVYAYIINFTNENVGIASYNNIIQVTTDGGYTWKLLTYSNIRY